MKEITKIITLYPGGMVLKFLMVTLSLNMVVSCKRGALPLTKAEEMKIVANTLQTLHQYHTDIGKEGFSAELKYLDNSNAFFWVPPGYAIPISYDSARAVLEQNAPLYASIKNSWDTLMVVPISKEHAIFTGRFSSTMTDTSGKTTMHEFIETGLLVKRKNGWKLSSGQTSLLNQMKTNFEIENDSN